MDFPADIEHLIVAYTWAWRSPLRSNWREGSKIIKHLKENQWWKDYVYDHSKHKIVFGENISDTWYEWCQDKLIIGPPRYRSDRELTGFDEEYMSDYDLERHYIPWVHTWPKQGDQSWCKVHGVPDWAKQEYISKSISCV